MELNERETLVKVEQQLKNSIENQAQITVDMREIFGRIDSESKILAGVRGDFQTHLETSIVQRQNCDARLSLSSKELDHTSAKIKELQDRHELAMRQLQDLLNKEEDAREAIEKDFAVFKESISTSIRNFKLLVGILGTVFGIFTPYVTLVVKDVLGK
jgi:chromosome condensin MukBEF complex kleisin-like MukF subunit